MKVILSALYETEYRPRAGWWGYADEHYNYLMRYNHKMMVWLPGWVLSTYAETVSDKRGIEFARNYVINMSLYDNLNLCTTLQLEKMLNRHVLQEKYEEAALLQREINSRQTL